MVKPLHVIIKLPSDVLSSSGLKDQLRERMRAAGEAAVSEARRCAPVKTGRLRDSIGYTVTDAGESMTLAVGTDVPYAALQEMGNSKIRGKRYLEQGIAAGAETLKG